MELIHIDQSNKGGETEGRVNALIDAWPTSDIFKKKEARFRLHKHKDEAAEAQGKKKKDEYTQNTLVQAWLLAKRSWSDTLREPLKYGHIDIDRDLYLSIYYFHI